jgi:hypothetical protein
VNWNRRAADKVALAGARFSASLATWVAASLLGVLMCFTIPACKQSSDASDAVERGQKAALRSIARAKAENALVQQAASSYRQRIQVAASEHAANAKRMQDAKVLDMGEVTQREQLEPKREVVRKFLASNEALKSLLVNEEALFKEELVKLNVPQARIKSELNTFQSGIRGKAASLRMRETEQRIGDSLLGALDFLDGIWGEWNYSKEYSQVQFSPPGALSKYNEFMEALEAASKEQKELQGQ